MSKSQESLMKTTSKTRYVWQWIKLLLNNSNRTLAMQFGTRRGSTFKFGKLASFLRILETSLYIDTLLSYFGVLVLCYLNFCFFQSIKTCVASLSIIYYPCILAFELQLFSFQHSKVINICKTSDPIHILVVILIKFYNTYVCQ